VPKLVGRGPVLDLACGRGELLELLGEQGIVASGVDPDEELVAVAVSRGLPAEAGAAAEALGRVDDSSVGAVVMLRAVERLTGEAMIDLVALSARKVGSGGRIVVEALDPSSPAALSAAARDPSHVRLFHPDCLTFLFREAGFAEVAVERGSAPERFLVVAAR
jgi:SAM-dependent methyltransferase